MWLKPEGEGCYQANGRHMVWVQEGAGKELGVIHGAPKSPPPPPAGLTSSITFFRSADLSCVFIKMRRVAQNTELHVGTHDGHQRTL